MMKFIPLPKYAICYYARFAKYFCHHVVENIIANITR